MLRPVFLLAALLLVVLSGCDRADPVGPDGFEGEYWLKAINNRSLPEVIQYNGESRAITKSLLTLRKGNRAELSVQFRDAGADVDVEPTTLVQTGSYERVEDVIELRFEDGALLEAAIASHTRFWILRDGNLWEYRR